MLQRGSRAAGSQQGAEHWGLRMGHEAAGTPIGCVHHHAAVAELCLGPSSLALTASCLVFLLAQVM